MGIGELALLFENEKKSKTLCKIRKDFYRAAAICIQKLRERYQRELALAPDSKAAEMARRELERAKKDLEEIVHSRARKILKNSLQEYFEPSLEFESALTPEEKKFLEGIKAVITQFVTNTWLWEKSIQQEQIQKSTEKVERDERKSLPKPELKDGIEVSQNLQLIVFTTEGSIALPEQNIFYRRGDIAALGERVAKILIKEKKAQAIYPM